MRPRSPAPARPSSTRASACLDDHRGALAAVLEALGSGDAVEVHRAVAAVSTLPSTASCVDPAAVERRPAPPENAAVQARVDALRRDLVRARGLTSAGRYAAALALAEATLTAAADDATMVSRSTAADRRPRRVVGVPLPGDRTSTG